VGVIRGGVGVTALARSGVGDDAESPPTHEMAMTTSAVVRNIQTRDCRTIDSPRTSSFTTIRVRFSRGGGRALRHHPRLSVPHACIVANSRSGQDPFTAGRDWRVETYLPGECAGWPASQAVCADRGVSE
jgi:hypothetical protein